MNSYEQLIQLRDMVGEASAAHWSDRELLKNLNISQNNVALVVAQEAEHWLTVSTTVTPSNSVITWPSDCSKPIYLEEVTSGRPVPFGTDVRDRRVSRLSGTTLYSGQYEAYLEKDKITINSDSYSNQCYLWYQIRVPALHVGTASAGGAASLTLSAHDGAGVASGGFGARQIADYYNNAQIQVVSGTGVGAPDTISDYTAARVATVTGTYDNTSVYGTISRLPEEAHYLMILEAAMITLAKPSAAIDPKYWQYMRGLYKDAKEVFDEWCVTQRSGSHRTRTTELET